MQENVRSGGTTYDVNGWDRNQYQIVTEYPLLKVTIRTTMRTEGGTSSVLWGRNIKFQTQGLGTPPSELTPMTMFYWNIYKLALLADAFYKLKCPSACPCVRLSVRLSVCSLLRYRLNVFLPPLPEVGFPIFLEIQNPWGKVIQRSGLGFEHFCLEIV